jgi:MarR family transcriptional regulator, organic hydroperoxide resistance regulator
MLSERAEQSDGAYDAVIATYKVMKRSIAELLSEEGLTQPQFSVLKTVAKNGVTPMKGISDELLVNPANITGTVDRLESKGLIERMARKGDRRATMIGLTPKGTAVQKRVATRYGESVQKALQAFTSDEQRMLRDLLEKLQREMSRKR